MVNSQCELTVLGSSTAEKINMIVPLEDQEEEDEMAVTVFIHVCETISKIFNVAEKHGNSEFHSCTE